MTILDLYTNNFVITFCEDYDLLFGNTKWLQESFIGWFHWKIVRIIIHVQDSHVFYRLQNVSSNSRNYDYLLMCLSTKKVKVVISDNDHSFLYFTFVLLDDLYHKFMEMTISDHLHHLQSTHTSRISSDFYVFFSQKSMYLITNKILHSLNFHHH